MHPSELLTEERAVSPVIGVILMVAVTVILAAVIGTFVLGLGQNVQNRPQVAFDYDFNQSNTSVEVVHRGGERLRVGDNTGELLLTADDGSADETWIGPSTTQQTLQAGNRKVYDYTDNGTTVRVVWNSVDGRATSTLGRARAPS